MKALSFLIAVLLAGCSGGGSTSVVPPAITQPQTQQTNSPTGSGNGSVLVNPTPQPTPSPTATPNVTVTIMPPNCRTLGTPPNTFVYCGGD